MSKVLTSLKASQSVDQTCIIHAVRGGFLNSWKWPDIPGLENFQGKLLHTARWDEAYDYRNKKVAVIGSGSSALQVVPSIQPDVLHLDAYIRSRTYIPEPLASAFMEQEHCRE